MIPTDHDLATLVQMIWSTTLGLEMAPGAAPDDASLWPTPSVEAQVHITGTWRGVVVLHASHALAVKVAHIMLSLGRRNPTPEDIQDAFGEVANMTGGNIKGLLADSDARLSLPSVVLGADYSVRVPRSRQMLRGVYYCDGEPMVVTLLEAQ